MKVNFNGYGENAATFIADSTLTKAFVPVKISADGTVSPCSKGENFCGICTEVRDGYASVVLSGYVLMPTTAAVTLGYQKLSTGDNGAVVSATSGREYLVINSDTSSVGFIL